MTDWVDRDFTGISVAPAPVPQRPRDCNVWFLCLMCGAKLSVFYSQFGKENGGCNHVVCPVCKDVTTEVREPDNYFYDDATYSENASIPFDWENDTIAWQRYNAIKRFHEAQRTGRYQPIAYDKPLVARLLEEPDLPTKPRDGTLAIKCTFCRATSSGKFSTFIRFCDYFNLVVPCRLCDEPMTLDYFIGFEATVAWDDSQSVVETLSCSALNDIFNKWLLFAKIEDYRWKAERKLLSELALALGDFVPSLVVDTIAEYAHSTEMVVPLARRSTFSSHACSLVFDRAHGVPSSSKKKRKQP